MAIRPDPVGFRDPRLSAAKLADLIGIKQRQAQRIIDSLKNKAGLKRRGARKNGEWYFDGADDLADGFGYMPGVGLKTDTKKKIVEIAVRRF